MPPGEESHGVKEKGSCALGGRPFSPSKGRQGLTLECLSLLDLSLSGHPGNELQLGLPHSLCTSSHDGLCSSRIFFLWIGLVPFAFRKLLALYSKAPLLLY